MKKIRVLVFGATGTGKTSLCNVLTGRDRATDNGAVGVTAKAHSYSPIAIDGYSIEVIDTVGLHESGHGTVPADVAVIALIDLLEKARDGFNLLIHVARASRITKEHDEDHEYFVNKMALGNIPVILAVTGCENEDPMDAWVQRNVGSLSRFSYKDIVATCCATGGPMEEHFAPLRNVSKTNLINSITSNALTSPYKIYDQSAGNSLDKTLTRLWNDFVDLSGLPKKYRRKVNESALDLMQRLGVSKKIRDAAIEHIPELAEKVAFVINPTLGMAVRFARRLFGKK